MLEIGRKSLRVMLKTCNQPLQVMLGAQVQSLCFILVLCNQPLLVMLDIGRQPL
jgi:hypothetical protein